MGGLLGELVARAMTALPTHLRDDTFRWLADDIDPTAQAELQGVLARAMTGDQAASTDLADRMSVSLTFGTACPARPGAGRAQTA